MRTHLLTIILATLTAVASIPAITTAGQSPSLEYQCQPTEEDEMGPFYRSGAPLRSTIGQGYLLTGDVKSAADCKPIPSVLIEFWQTGSDGRYDDAHRAAIITGKSGHYQFETDFPAEYLTRPAHIHIRVSAEGFQTLVTQHYLQSGSSDAVFDLVLMPAP